jgi:diadenosine tetraphosphate (Ap4A) HIT family hydrolase
LIIHLPTRSSAVIGDVNGQFPAVFKKLATLHAKNNFAFVLIVGNLFASTIYATEEDDTNVQSLLDGKITIPCTTYFALASHALPRPIIEKLEATDGEVCEHLLFLGKRTNMKTSDGIRLIALGGQLDANIIVGETNDKYLPYYGETDAQTLQAASAADILVTNQWPAGIRTRSKVDFQPTTHPQEQECLAKLCTALTPRYHFSTSGDISYEREPFFHAPTAETNGLYPITRFISLAAYGNPNKHKWIYAFSLDPTASHAVSVPAGTTASPVSGSDKKRPAPGQRDTELVYEDGQRGSRFHNKRRKGGRGPLQPSECFFCLSNANIQTHLISSIGNNSYLTVAKGPLPTLETYPKLGFPGHVLVIPMDHKPTLASMEEAERNAAYTEMQNYRSSMNKMLRSIAGEDYGSVTWELSKSSLPHSHWQYMPVDADFIRKGLVEAAFQALSENLHFPPIKKQDVGDGFYETSDFFRVMIWDPKEPEDKYTSLVMRIDGTVKFHSQFGREVLAKLMRLDNRVDWHHCGQTQAEEEADVASFNKAFKEFDFTDS